VVDDAVIESSGVVVRYFDALTGWARRAWISGTVVAVVAGLLVAAAGHLVSGLVWLALAVTAWGVRSVLAGQRTEIGPSWVTVRAAFGSRAIEAREVRAVAVVHPDLAGPSLVVHGHSAREIAVPVRALDTDAALRLALRRFVDALPAGTPVDREAVAVLGAAAPSR